jgi:hypothetical protein
MPVYLVKAANFLQFLPNGGHPGRDHHMASSE